ncbi:hypothetical protein VTJ83DRAFT_1630 [Remersonia thermophila]|uniref:Uncharacterized protein n=1 Tax=Remersonia thermophila TaxID=72144 RepID=A0ABR4DGH6_9PEZI
MATATRPPRVGPSRHPMVKGANFVPRPAGSSKLGNHQHRNRASWKSASEEMDIVLELIDFFQNIPPPAGNSMALRDTVQIMSKQKHDRLRRLWPFRKKPKRKAPAKQYLPPKQHQRPIRLPDSVVVGTTIGGYRHIAISIPFEPALVDAPGPRPDEGGKAKDAKRRAAEAHDTPESRDSHAPSSLLGTLEREQGPAGNHEQPPLSPAPALVGPPQPSPPASSPELPAPSCQASASNDASAGAASPIHTGLRGFATRSGCTFGEPSADRSDSPRSHLTRSESANTASSEAISSDAATVDVEPAKLNRVSGSHASDTASFYTADASRTPKTHSVRRHSAGSSESLASGSSLASNFSATFYEGTTQTTQTSVDQAPDPPAYVESPTLPWNPWNQPAHQPGTPTRGRSLKSFLASKTGQAGRPSPGAALSNRRPMRRRRARTLDMTTSRAGAELKPFSCSSTPEASVYLVSTQRHKVISPTKLPLRRRSYDSLPRSLPGSDGEDWDQDSDESDDGSDEPDIPLLLLSLRILTDCFERLNEGSNVLGSVELVELIKHTTRDLRRVTPAVLDEFVKNRPPTAPGPVVPSAAGESRSGSDGRSESGRSSRRASGGALSSDGGRSVRAHPRGSALREHDPARRHTWAGAQVSERSLLLAAALLSSRQQSRHEASPRSASARRTTIVGYPALDTLREEQDQQHQEAAWGRPPKAVSVSAADDPQGLQHLESVMNELVLLMKR